MMRKIITVLLVLTLLVSFAAPALAITVYGNAVAVTPPGDNFAIEHREDGTVDLAGEDFDTNISEVVEITMIIVDGVERSLFWVPYGAVTVTSTLDSTYIGTSYWSGSGGFYEMNEDGTYYFDGGWAGDVQCVFDGEPIVSWIGYSVGYVSDWGEGPTSPNLLYTSLPKVLTAKPTAAKVLINGAFAAFEAYEIDGYNYFKLRDLAYILSGTESQFEVEWSEEQGAIILTSGLPYTEVGGEMSGKGDGVKTPAPTASKIILDGEEVALEAYNIENNNYFKLRDIGMALDFLVAWLEEEQTIFIDTALGYEY